MGLPEHVDYIVVGAGIHGLSSAWRLAERLNEAGQNTEGRVIVLDKDSIAAGASGIACGVIRNNYFQPAMRHLMAHSVGVWESDPQAFCYYPVGYMQISCEAMRDDIGQIFSEQQEIGYESVFIEGADASTSYMKGIFHDWRAQNITSVLHEKRGGYANNIKSLNGLAKKAQDLGVQIMTGIEVKGFVRENSSNAILSVETDQGSINCKHVVIAAGPWVRNFWDMLGLPN